MTAQNKSDLLIYSLTLHTLSYFIKTMSKKDYKFGSIGIKKDLKHEIVNEAKSRGLKVYQLLQEMFAYWKKRK